MDGEGSALSPTRKLLVEWVCGDDTGLGPAASKFLISVYAVARFRLRPRARFRFGPTSEAVVFFRRNRGGMHTLALDKRNNRDFATYVYFSIITVLIKPSFFLGGLFPYFY